MKDYKKLIKNIEKNNDFEIRKTTKKSTIKIIHKSSGKLYSVHPGDNAIKPLENWINKIKNNGEI